MKYLIFLPFIFLLSCGTSNKAITTTETRVNDTITQIVTTNSCEGLTRQERLAIKDSLKHEIKKAKIERRVIKDSIRFVYKTRIIEKVRFKDSIRWTTKQIKSENKKETKITRIENKRSLWWVWMLIGSFITIILGILIKRLLP